MSSQGAGSTGSARSAARPAKGKAAAATSTSGPTSAQHDDMKDPEYEEAQSKKEFYWQEHWQKSLPNAEKEPSVVLVFNKSPDAIATDIKKMAGPNTKITTVDRILGIYDDIEEGKSLGTVQAGLVPIGLYGSISDKYEVETITVKFGNQKRMAYIPVKARKAVKQQGFD
ncbi:uncharacterized protein B0T15DRAFT_503477 [Chaetomium strumarium]|uniref:Uncharacterized protein n=1 Tax=Chaetomium strumarium TaxID=1170767 RepID=A0AAJ0GQR0_9PEZI|nr:hypothetical protein B0T15DRAFT_503477 [Chaetomium strumarium]